jgi:pyruvate dehydrogenase E1 component alpha subunit
MKEAGAAVDAPPGKNGFSLISGDKLVQLYSTMLKCRMLEERIGLLCKQGKLQACGAAWAGQEAAVAGIVLDLSPEDTLCLFRSSLAASFIKGIPLDKIFRQLFAGAASPDGDSPAPGPTLRAALDLSIQVAKANKKAKSSRIAVIFCGAAPAVQESWQAALELAGSQDLPMIFVCQSSEQAESANPKARTKAKGAAAKARENGIPHIPVDGSDVVAVYRVASEAIARARKGFGPTMIDCRAYALNGDRAIGPAQEHLPEDEEWQTASDPILKMERYLTGKGLFGEDLRTEAGIQFNKDLDAAIALAEKPQGPQGK